MKTLNWLAAAVFALAALCAQAQTYPGKPVRFVVPFASGGPPDIIGRLLGQRLSEAWGQPVLVENRPGAGGNTGSAQVAKAAPDGYTVLVTTSAIAVNASLWANPGFDLDRDLIGVAHVATSPNIFVAGAASGIGTLREALDKAKSGKFNYGSPGTGTTPNLSAEYLFRVLAKANVTHVPYKAGGPALTAALTGEVAPPRSCRVSLRRRSQGGAPSPRRATSSPITSLGRPATNQGWRIRSDSSTQYQSRKSTFMTVIDIHTHMMSDSWLAVLKQHGAPHYSIGPIKGGYDAIHEEGAPFLTLTPGMLDYGVRFKAMDKAGVDLAVISLTCPSVYWGSADVSSHAARVINDDMRSAQTAHPDRIRFLATLPWQYPELAIGELARACDAGAVGVMVLANIRGMHLTDPHLAPIWKAIDARGLPVLVHPTNPPGHREMDLMKYNLIATVGFVYDTTLAVTRMVMDGFIDRFPNLKIIAAHGGGTIPYINARIDKFHELMANSREKISDSPSSYFQRIYYDAAVYQDNALRACIDLAGPSHVLYGSDYPHVTGDMPGCLARVNALPVDQRDAIRGENARRLFGI